MSWQNQHSGQIKTTEGTTKIRHPATPPAIITSNQKKDIPTEELCYIEKGKQAEQLQKLQELNLVSCGDKNVKNFMAENLKNYFTVWQKFTSDRVILDIIKNGLKTNFKVRPGIISAPKTPHSEQEIKIINTKIKKLLAKGVIIECERDKGGFISTIFTRQKKDGYVRTILNLKHLNHYVNYQHFKMQSLNDVFKNIKKGLWMASVDLKDAFFTVPVHKLRQIFFMFEWIQKFYKFVGILNGYPDAMRIFTKILKPVFGHLR